MLQPIQKIIINSNVFKYKIKPYLSLIDLYNFWKSGICVSQVYKLLMNKIYKRVYNAFKIHMGTNYKKFSKAMEISEGIISGSSIFHAIHKEFELASDIDIYFKNKTQYENFIEKSGFECYKIFSKKNNSKTYNNLPHINQIYDAWYKNIQCIVLNDIDIKEYIKENFDFDISKNFVYFRDGNIYTELYNIYDVVTKFTKINNVICKFNITDYKMDALYKRLYKYVANKHIKFNIDTSIDTLAEYYFKFYKDIYISNLYVGEFSNIKPFTIMVHNYNKPVILYKYICTDTCILKYSGIEHYHSLSNDGRLINRDEDTCGIYKNSIETIHIKCNVRIPSYICVKKNCKTRKLKANAYGMGYCDGMYILIKK